MTQNVILMTVMNNNVTDEALILLILTIKHYRLRTVPPLTPTLKNKTGSCYKKLLNI